MQALSVRQRGGGPMPVGFMKLPTGPHSTLERFHGDPAGLRAYVEKVVDAAEPKAVLKDLYFDIGKERAYAVVQDLDKYEAVKAVARILGAEGYEKAITADQAGEALEIENRIRE